MADKGIIQVDDDWKRQAQEEKQKLAEQAAAAKTAAPAVSVAGASVTGGGARSEGPVGAGAAGSKGAGVAGTPPVGIAGLVQTLMTQALYYMGDLGGRGGESAVNLDLAKYHLDLLAVLEDKTRGNLTEQEKNLLDQVLYEVRMRYVSAASQYIV